MISRSDWQILDCTLRDGGYYTNWDFSQECVDRYLEAVSCLPVSYIELGYRALPEYGKYKGAYYYLPLSYIESAREKLPAETKLGVMLDVKNCPPEHSAKLLQECQGLIDFVRLAADPRKLNVALELAYSIKRLGFEVGLNLMYLSSDYDKTTVLEEIQSNKGVCDIVSLVDSYGACYPTEVAQAVSLAKHILDVPVGFHGHDNLTLAFANALAALDAGADVVDGTLQGMGRGAGNLRTELIASYLESNLGNVPDFFAAAPALDHFSEMQMMHKWGAQIPYIIAGLNGLPQAPVMEWMSKKRFDMPAIVRALTTFGKDEDVQQQKKSGNVAKPLRDALPKLHDKKVVVVGGGATALEHTAGVAEFCEKNDAFLIHSSGKHLASYLQTAPQQFLCLVGDEFNKITLSSRTWIEKISGFVIDTSAYTGVPDEVSRSGKLFSSDVTGGRTGKEALSSINPLALALAAARDLCAEEVFLVGFDGYSDHTDASWLSDETQMVLKAAEKELQGISISSLLPTRYDLRIDPLYARLATKAD